MPSSSPTSLERHDHVGRGLVDARVEPFRAPDARVDAGRHRLAQRQQLVSARGVAGNGDLDAIEHAGVVQRAAETHERRVGRAGLARAPDLVEGARRRRRRRQLEGARAAP